MCDVCDGKWMNTAEPWRDHRLRHTAGEARWPPLAGIALLPRIHAPKERCCHGRVGAVVLTQQDDRVGSIFTHGPAVDAGVVGACTKIGGEFRVERVFFGRVTVYQDAMSSRGRGR